MARIGDAVRPRLRYASPDSPPSFPSTSPEPKAVRGRKPLLRVNSISRAGLGILFEAVDGLSEMSARCIATERDLNGPFTDASDFSCRVPGIPHSMLCNFFRVSFAPPPTKPTDSASRSSDLSVLCEAIEEFSVRDTADGGEDTRRVVEDPPPAVENAAEPSPTANDSTLITFAAWNCARMSPRSPNFAKKCAVLERMVSDTPALSVIFLQEVIACASEHVTSRLRSCTGDPGWMAIGCNGTGRGPSHAHPRTYGDTCQVAVYNASKVKCLADSYVADSDANSVTFRRAPHVCIFEPLVPNGSNPGKLLCIANCHILQRAPRQEVELLADLVRSMRNACVRSIRRDGHLGLRRSGEVIYVVAGDFNQGSESVDFGRLREEDFVELVKSPRPSGTGSRVAAKVVVGDGEISGSGGVDIRYLTEATTSGGLHIDNVWMNREVRCASLIDAWQYVPGGNGRSLYESGYASAGRMRSERSDHIPLVVKLQLGTVEHDVREGNVTQGIDSGGWVVKNAFQVCLHH